jgi:hypothetical protein
MPKKHSISLPVLMLFLVLLVAVTIAIVGIVQTPRQAGEATEVAALTPTQSGELSEPVAVTEVPAVPTIEPTATLTQEPTATPTLEPTPTEVVVADYCIECHTDKEQLIATAKEEEPAESESKGVG